MIESTKSCERIAEAVVWLTLVMKRLKFLSQMLYLADTSEDDVTEAG
jgi:hypothetical protein